jgi:hypothetical protein
MTVRTRAREGRLARCAPRAHGVLAGVADGIGDSAANTAKDGWHMVTGIGGAAKHLGTGIAHTAEHVGDSIF